MKRVVRFMLVHVLTLAVVIATQAQSKVDDDRMKRDIEIAENVLETLIKQKFDKRGFFPMEIQGRYLPGFGVTFRVPSDSYSPWLMNIGEGSSTVVVGGTPEAKSYSYSYSTDDAPGARTRDKEKAKTKIRSNRDSVMMIYNQRVIEAAKEFLSDYADLIGQLTPQERVAITNRGGENSSMYFPRGGNSKRSMLNIEATKGDISQLQQGKISRDQFFKNVKVVNTESVEELAPDLELFSSIFSRLYRSDLSKTYFSQENIYYERMKDFGAIYYMQVYSSNPYDNPKRHNMPTLGLDDVDQATRDKKVKDLYPAFEKDVKENMLEYGRTLRSLNDNESLVLNIRMTTCGGCGIPSTLELSVPNTVLKDYNMGKVTKDAAVAMVNVKKGANQ
jgi:hypothetical protein